MTEIPSLDITWPVANMGREDITHLEQVHFQAVAGPSLSDSYEATQKLLGPSRHLHARALSNSEFLRVQDYLGDQSLDEAAVGRLAEHLRQILVDPNEILEVPTLPTRLLRRRDGRKGHTMIIANNTIVPAKRTVAKREISTFVRTFLGVELPEEVWFNDRMACGVQMGVSRGGKEAELMYDLDVTITREEPLSETTKFGELIVRELPRDS